jgi:hypothetical protein
VLWYRFEEELDAIREVLVKVHRHSADECPELRMQMNLVASWPRCMKAPPPTTKAGSVP